MDELIPQTKEENNMNTKFKIIFSKEKIKKKLINNKKLLIVLGAILIIILLTSGGIIVKNTSMQESQSQISTTATPSISPTATPSPTIFYNNPVATITQTPRLSNTPTPTYTPSNSNSNTPTPTTSNAKPEFSISFPSEGQTITYDSPSQQLCVVTIPIANTSGAIIYTNLNGGGWQTSYCFVPPSGQNSVQVKIKNGANIESDIQTRNFIFVANY